MIHRLLVYDRKFNCRLDRRYPVVQHEKLNALAMAMGEETTVRAPSNPRGNEPSPTATSTRTNWTTLVVKKTRFRHRTGASPTTTLPSAVAASGSLAPIVALDENLQQLHLNGDAPQQTTQETQETNLLLHSEQLILGLTFSLRNMLLKLAPVSGGTGATVSASNSPLPDGHSFVFKTSRYRLLFYEAPSGWRLVMLADASAPASAATSVATALGPVTPDTALRHLFGTVFLDAAVLYPLGALHTPLKSTQHRRIAVKNDVFARAGFLARLDSFITHISPLF